MKIVLLFLLCFSLLTPSLALAEVPMESYVARIGLHDHSTPTTKKYLKLANYRIGQDRANYHRFKIRDAEDEGDGMFHDKKERKWFYKKLAEPYAIPAEVKRAVENGTPLIRVDVYSSHVKVSLVSRSTSAAPGASTDHLVGGTPAQDPGLWLNSHPMGGKQARSRGITNFSNVCWMDTGTGLKRIQKRGNWVNVEVTESRCANSDRQNTAYAIHQARTGQQLRCCWAGARGWAYGKYLIRR
ncbi:MAG: hypothetical protein ACON3Z_01760 [Bradymonadia bacterium]